MTTDSQFSDSSHSQFSSYLTERMIKHTNESTGAMDMVKRDRFELLSAYLDGEVTIAERRQVEEWLNTDASVQCLYARLLKLRQGLKAMPTPVAEQSAEVMVECVLTRLRRRYRLAWTFGGAAVAACVIGAITGLVPGAKSTLPQLANKIQQVEPQPIKALPSAGRLLVALNNPVIEIPKTAVAFPENPVNEEPPPQGSDKQDIN